MFESKKKQNNLKGYNSQDLHKGRLQRVDHVFLKVAKKRKKRKINLFLAQQVLGPPCQQMGLAVVWCLLKMMGSVARVCCTPSLSGSLALCFSYQGMVHYCMFSF